MKPLGVAFVGCGSVMQNAYTPLALNHKAHGRVNKIVGCDIDPDQLRRADDRHHLDGTTTDLDLVLSDPTIDLVAVTTSIDAHAQLAIRSLQAGKHVLVEKSMATSLDDAAHLLEVSRRSPGKLVCAPHVLLSNDYQLMLRQMPSLGRPILARARYGWEGPNWSQWFYELEGGVLYDLGIYNLTALTGLLGPAVEVSAMAMTSRPTREVAGESMPMVNDEVFQLTLRHENGAISTVMTGFGIQQYRGAAIEIYGLSGTQQMLGDDWAPEGVQSCTSGDDFWRDHGARSRHWPWTDGLSHLIASIQHNTEPYTRPEHAYHVLEICLAAVESSKTGRHQPISSTFVPPPPLPQAASTNHIIHDRVHEDAQ